MGEQIETLGNALPKEMARVRDEVRPAYLAIGQSGECAAMMMQQDLDAAESAMIEGDIVAMVRIYKSLKEYSL